jgi:hypothetical protein
MPPRRASGQWPADFHGQWLERVLKQLPPLLPVERAPDRTSDALLGDFLPDLTGVAGPQACVPAPRLCALEA